MAHAGITYVSTGWAASSEKYVSPQHEYSLAGDLNRISVGELRERVRATMLRQAEALLIEPGGDPEALAIFDDPSECGVPDGQAIRWLLDQGVTPHALGSSYGVRASRVRFLPNGHYVPEQLGDFTFVFAIIGVGGIYDAAAWCPTSGRTASRLGVGYALGQAQVTRKSLLPTRKLRVRRDPLDWLRSDRHGIVVIDPAHAAHELADVDIEADDAGHADELAACLRLSPPRITFPRPARTS
jgi:hypothetical protein